MIYSKLWTIKNKRQFYVLIGVHGTTRLEIDKINFKKNSKENPKMAYWLQALIFRFSICIFSKYKIALKDSPMACGF